MVRRIHGVWCRGAVEGTKEERSGAVGLLDIYIAAPLQQKLDDVKVALLHGPHQSGLSAFASRVPLCHA
jgi:hypothetical protein